MLISGASTGSQGASADSEELAAAALAWVSSVAMTEGDGVWWSSRPSSDEPDPGIYHGVAGIVLALLEAYAHFGDQRWAELAAGGTRWLCSAIDSPQYAPYPSLYGGLAGMAWALHSAAGYLGDDAARAAAVRGLARVRAGFDGERWGDPFELLFGNAGIALAALRIGDTDLAETAVVPYRRTAETTEHGVHWEARRGHPARLHHISHGTLGVVYALAATGAAVGSRELTDLALAGAADVTARNEAGPDGFLVPHSDPQQVAPGLERYAYGWCHGPAGDAQVFRLLGQLTGDGAWRSLIDGCWHTITTSGLPARLSPGFWDNSGRCCGTAGVLALACDREVESGDGRAFADVLVADIAQRATVDASGARWSNYEHRVSPPELEPRPGWSMGNAGLIRELLRYARISDGRDPAYAIAWPDQPAARRGADGGSSSAAAERAANG
jgi:Lanthionine synthetase C-like protein